MPTFDHIAINAGENLAGFAAAFTNLGFWVTDASVHTLGSVNRTMPFGDHYLELIGTGNGARKDLAESHTGIDGLVFKLENARRLAAKLDSAELMHQPVQHFSRPVGQTGLEARFSVVRLVAGQFPQGRIYYCEHHTPELIFSKTAHPNGVTAITRLYIASVKPGETAMAYARLDPVDNLELVINTPEALSSHFGGEAVKEGRFCAIGLACDSVDAIEALAKTHFARYHREGSRLWLAVVPGVILEFQS